MNENKRKARFEDEEPPAKRVCRRAEFMLRSLNSNAQSAIIPPQKCFLGSEGPVLDRTVPRLHCGIRNKLVKRKQILIEHHPTENRMVITNVGVDIIRKNDTWMKTKDVEFLDINDKIQLAFEDGENPTYEFELIETSGIGSSCKIPAVDQAKQLEELNKKKRMNCTLEHFLRSCERSENLKLVSVLIHGCQLRASFQDNLHLTIRHRADALDLHCLDQTLALPLFFTLCKAVQSNTAPISFISDDDLESFHFVAPKDPGHGIWLPFKSIKATEFLEDMQFQDLFFDSGTLHVDIAGIKLRLDIAEDSVHWEAQDSASSFLDGSTLLASLSFAITHRSLFTKEGLVDYALKMIIENTQTPEPFKEIKKAATVTLNRCEEVKEWQIPNVKITKAFSVDDNHLCASVEVCGKQYYVSLNCLKSADIQACSSESGSGLLACPGAMAVFVSLHAGLNCVSIPRLREGLAGLDNLQIIVVSGISECVLKSSWVDQIDSTTHQLSLQSCDLAMVADANMQTLASALLAFLEVVGDSFEATAHLEKFLQEKSKTFLHTFGEVLVRALNDDLSDESKQNVCETPLKRVLCEKLAKIAEQSNSDSDAMKLYEFVSSCVTSMSELQPILASLAEKFKGKPEMLKDALKMMRENLNSLETQFSVGEIMALLQFDETQAMCMEKICAFKGDLSDLVQRLPEMYVGKFAKLFVDSFVQTGDKTMFSTLRMLAEKDAFSQETCNKLVTRLNDDQPSIPAMRVLYHLARKRKYREQGEYCLRLIAKYKAMGDVNEGELRCLVEVVFDVLNLKSNPQKPAILTEVLLLATKFKEVATFDLCITRYQKLEITNQDECLEFLYTQKFRSTDFLKNKTFDEVVALLLEFGKYIGCVEYLKRKIQSDKISAEDLMKLDEEANWPNPTFSKLSNRFPALGRNVSDRIGNIKLATRIKSLKNVYDFLLVRKATLDKENKQKKCQGFADAIRKKAAKEIALVNTHLCQKLRSICGCGSNHRNPDSCTICMSKAAEFLPVFQLQAIQETYGGKATSGAKSPLMKRNWFNKGMFLKVKLKVNTVLAKLERKEDSWIFPN